MVPPRTAAMTEHRLSINFVYAIEMASGGLRSDFVPDPLAMLGLRNDRGRRSPWFRLQAQPTAIIAYAAFHRDVYLRSATEQG